LHPEKTGLIWFGSADNLNRLQNASLDIHVGQVTIKPVDVVRDMGDMLDSRRSCDSTSASARLYQHASSI
jgi:hypothetical protein